MVPVRLNIAYMRVAHREHGEGQKEKKESSSITMQRGIIYRYLRENPEYFCGLIEIIDDGYSGSELAGPGIKKVLQLVEMDCVGTVIVSDISRFTRNHLEAVYYMSEFFPSHNAHIIAVDVEPSEVSIDFPKGKKCPHQAPECHGRG